MLDKVVEASVGVFDRRFLLSAFLPTLVFGVLTGITVAPSLLDRWLAQPVDVRVMGVLAIVAAALLAGLLLANLAPALIRLYEGYGRAGPLGRLLGRWGRAHHRSRLLRLAAADAYQQVERRYPLPSRSDEVQPTTLGNVLRNAELYARDRYGMDAVVVWPRLYLVLPDHVRAAVAGVRGELELMLIVATLAVSYGVVAGVHALVVGSPWWRFLLAFVVPMLLAWCCYLGAVAVATAYGTQLKAVFDTYRRDLLDRAGGCVDDSEPRQWYRLIQFWYRAVPLNADVLTDDDLPPAAPTTPTGRRPRLGIGFAAAVALLALAGVLASP